MRRAGRELVATLGALGAYFFTVLPRVRRELRRWGPLPAAKVKNAEAVAVFATLAPRSRRAATVRAIVALQVAIDLRDELEEATGAILRTADDRRLERLEAYWRREVAALPSQGAVSAVLERAVQRCEEGQRFTHAAEHGDRAALEAWGRSLPAPPGYRWWEPAAGASSSVAAHTLIAAAASAGTSHDQAEAIDSAYNPSIGALTVLLDDLVDRERDSLAGSHNYTAYYADAADAAERIAAIASDARQSIAPLPHRNRHLAILAGVAGYYLSDPGAGDTIGRAVAAPLEASLGPSVGLLCAAAKAVRRSERIREPAPDANDSGEPG